MASWQHVKKYVNLKKESRKRKWKELILFPCKTKNVQSHLSKINFPISILDPRSCLFVKALETSYLVSLNMKGNKSREVHTVTHPHVD